MAHGAKPTNTSNLDSLSHSTTMDNPEGVIQPPILIIGAGVSGLLVAQHLRKLGVPFRLFERDADFSGGSRGVGWGLTLHWSLPALRSLLPEELVCRLPEAYADRRAVQEEGLVSTFPFFDLSTVALVGRTPAMPESDRIRVTRERLRRVLADGLTIEVRRRVQRSRGLPSQCPMLTADPTMYRLVGKVV
jgi:glycine/D-amino acid oxidase-like deaminating enzyme